MMAKVIENSSLVFARDKISLAHLNEVSKNKNIKLIHSHQDQVINLPEETTLVASNDSVPNAMYFIGDHIMSIQGHPEFTNEYAYDVVCKRRELLGEESFQSAEHSLLNEQSNYLEVTNWWIDFFRYQFKSQQ